MNTIKEINTYLSYSLTIMTQITFEYFVFFYMLYALCKFLCIINCINA